MVASHLEWGGMLTERDSVPSAVLIVVSLEGPCQIPVGGEDAHDPLIPAPPVTCAEAPDTRFVFLHICYPYMVLGGPAHTSITGKVPRVEHLVIVQAALDDVFKFLDAVAQSPPARE